jgi:hypothetical protein
MFPCRCHYGFTLQKTRLSIRRFSVKFMDDKFSKPAFPKLAGGEPICGGSRKAFEM